MRFEWDESKNTANISKHGIDFNDVPDIFQHPMLALRDDRSDSAKSVGSVLVGSNC